MKKNRLLTSPGEFWKQKPKGLEKRCMLYAGIALLILDLFAGIIAGILSSAVYGAPRWWGFGLITAGIGLIPAGLLLWITACCIRSVFRPVSSICSAAERIAEGGFGTKCEVKRNDEIGVLAQNVTKISEAASRSETLQREFISSVSHELRTPLTAITGWSETLAYDEAIQGDSRRGIEIIGRESGRLTKMVNDLLEFTRIQDGRFALRLERMYPDAELEDCIYTYSTYYGKENITIDYTPAADPLPEIEGDPERLRQVFLNIFDNAVKYGRDGEVINVYTKNEPGWAVIKIRDHGCGIPPAELPHVKERFFKGSSKQRGSGIGLAVCDEIVNRHKGTLLIENAEGGGIVVTIRLPAAENLEKNGESNGREKSNGV